MDVGGIDWSTAIWDTSIDQAQPHDQQNALGYQITEQKTMTT